MEAGGWITSGAPHQDNAYLAGCGGFNTFWAYADGWPVGSVQATFRGSGNGILGFGNCYGGGVTNVYHNGQLIGSAGPNQNSQVKFIYKGGDILRITEENVGILKINSLQLNCHAQPPPVPMVSIPIDYSTRLTQDKRRINFEDYYSYY